MSQLGKRLGVRACVSLSKTSAGGRRFAARSEMAAGEATSDELRKAAIAERDRRAREVFRRIDAGEDFDINSLRGLPGTSSNAEENEEESAEAAAKWASGEAARA